MQKLIEELGYAKTPLGDLILRRRAALDGTGDIFEVKLGDAFLMSSQFTGGEVALAKIGLGSLTERVCDVVVGGLGLGYTAAETLDDPRVNELLVIEYLPDVISWHADGLVPLGAKLQHDRRCRLVTSFSIT